MLGEQGLDPVREGVVEKIRRRQVDGDADVEAVSFQIASCLTAAWSTTHVSGVHQAALLDDREERVRVEQAAGRVLPAHERLGAEGGAGRDLDLRLIVQHELVLD